MHCQATKPIQATRRQFLTRASASTIALTVLPSITLGETGSEFDNGTQGLANLGEDTVVDDISTLWLDYWP